MDKNVKIQPTWLYTSLNLLEQSSCPLKGGEGRRWAVNDCSLQFSSLFSVGETFFIPLLRPGAHERLCVRDVVATR